MTHLPTRLAAALAAALLCIPGCGLWSDSAPEQGFESDPADYSKNGKEYYYAGDYARSRDQWSKLLRKDPDNWMGRLAVGYCDYHLGLQQLASGDLEGGRKLLEQAEASFRDIWNGEIETSTTDVPDVERRQWQAALGIAMALRGQGFADKLQADRMRNRIQGLEVSDPQRPETARRIRSLEQRREANYKAATSLFERLAAMEHASPEAVKQLAELYVVQGRDAMAEKQFLRYLEMAEATFAAHKELEGKLEEEFASPKDREAAQGFLEQKLASNSRKRVEVLVNLGQLFFQKDAFDRALAHLERAHEVRPERLDIILKMAQCEGGRESYKTALSLLDQYIHKSTEQNREWSRSLALAYRLQTEYRRKLDQGSH